MLSSAHCIGGSKLYFSAIGCRYRAVIASTTLPRLLRSAIGLQALGEEQSSLRGLCVGIVLPILKFRGKYCQPQVAWARVYNVRIIGSPMDFKEGEILSGPGAL